MALFAAWTSGEWAMIITLIGTTAGSVITAVVAAILQVRNANAGKARGEESEKKIVAAIGKLDENQTQITKDAKEEVVAAVRGDSGQLPQKVEVTVKAEPPAETRRPV